MHTTSRADRERELESLLELIKAHPEHALTAERQRAATLQAMLGASERA